VLDKLNLRWNEQDLRRHLQPYVLGDLIGTGGVALVFGCRREKDARHDLVIKFPRVPDDEEVFVMTWAACLDALVHEATVLSRCAGISGIVQLVADRSQDVLPHLVMPRLGDRLDERLGENWDRPLDLEASVRVLHGLAVTLRQMHRVGVSHGDVSPMNILAGPGDSWVLIDPAPPELTTDDLGLRAVSGEARDVLGLGGTFLCAYYGVANYEEPPEDEVAELEEHPELLRLVRRMLGRSRYSIPSSDHVAKVAARVLRREFA